MRKSRCAYINDARSFNWIFLRLFTIELQVHLTLSALQAPAYSMSGVGRGVFSFLVIYENVVFMACVNRLDCLKFLYVVYQFS